MLSQNIILIYPYWRLDVTRRNSIFYLTKYFRIDKFFVMKPKEEFCPACGTTSDRIYISEEEWSFVTCHRKAYPQDSSG